MGCHRLGVAGVVRHHVDTRPADLLRFVAGGILLHDLVVVPLALVGAYLLNRAVPAPWRRWVQVTPGSSGLALTELLAL